jgi:hypothetical protein
MRLLALAFFLPLAGCALLPAKEPPPPPAAETTVPQLADVAAARRAAAGGATRLYRIDAAASEVRIFVFRGGKAPTRGKNHVLTTPELQGFVALRSELPTDASFMLGFSAEAMALDDPALRAAIGGSFAKPLSEEQIEGTRDNMLGDSVLDAEPHPEIVLRSVEIGGDWPMLVARVEVALHGSTQVYDSLLEVRRDDERLSAEGSLVIRQTDFGITPMSVLGGLLGLQDPIGIRYRIVARASED